MTRLPRLALLASLVLGITPACGGDDEASSVQDYIAGVDGYTRNLCECEYNNPLYLLALGKVIYGSADECLMDLPPNSAERGCINGLFEDQSVDYSSVLDCRAAALSRSNACLSKLTCTDTLRGDCYSTLADEIASCPDLPDAVETKLNDCLYN
jgi:hypothetical protein